MAQGAQALEEVTLIVESNPGNIQNPAAYRIEQCAYGEPTLSGRLV